MNTYQRVQKWHCISHSTQNRRDFYACTLKLGAFVTLDKCTKYGTAERQCWVLMGYDWAISPLHGYVESTCFSVKLNSEMCTRTTVQNTTASYTKLRSSP